MSMKKTTKIEGSIKNPYRPLTLAELQKLAKKEEQKASKKTDKKKKK